MLRRQTLLDKIRQEQLLNEETRRPRTYSPRRRYTPSPLPPPSRRSLPDLTRNYHISLPKERDMAHVKHVIEHQFKTQPTTSYQLPPLGSQAVVPAVSYPPPVIAQPYSTIPPTNDRWFNKADFMDMMMMQNAQMHHMVMQQLMVNNLGGHPYKYPIAVAAEPAARAPPAVYHHHTSSPAVIPAMPAMPAVHHYAALPPLDLGGYGRGEFYNPYSYGYY